MPILQAIAAISQNRAIGKLGKLPWHLPEDYAWFKQKTMGGTVIMGRKTYASIGKPLPGRQTVVLSRSGKPISGVTICPELHSLAKMLSEMPGPYWVCGGVEIYRQLLRNCDLLYLTRIKRVVDGDAFFPPFEDKFELDQIIHEDKQFSVERWTRLFRLDKTPIEPEPWPIASTENMD
jgi:dihydrofolate reductase